MLNEIFRAIEPIAKDIIDAYAYSAIMADYNPKKSDNPYSADAITKGVIKNYYLMSQMDSDNQGNKPQIHITYKDRGNSLPTIASEGEETPYDIAMKKTYKYNF